MDKKFLKAKDIAQLWGITPRRVNQLCTAGFINGAYKEGRYWLIPSDTTKPEILRNKQTPPLSGRLLPCPVGITSYKEVSKECYYVDKTLLIKDIIDDHSIKVTTGRSINIQCPIFAEVVAIFLTPPLVFGNKCFFT